MGFGKPKSYVIYKAERIVKHRYTCEKCDNITEWQESNVWMTAASVRKARPRRFQTNIERNIDELEKAEKKARASLKKLTKMLDTAASKEDERFFPGDPFFVEKYNEIFANGAECPCCNIRQSWYPAFAFKPDKKEYAKKYAKWALVLSSIVTLFAYFVWSTTSGTSFYGVLFFIAIPFILSAVSGFIGFIRASVCLTDEKYSPPQAGNFVSHKPEVVWGKIAVNVVGDSIEV